MSPYKQLVVSSARNATFLTSIYRYEDSHSDHKKQLTPRRRRPHYPPITPNACLKDSAASSAFDCMWQEVRLQPVQHLIACGKR